MGGDQHRGNEATGPFYDVYVRIPSGAHLDVIKARALQDARIPADKVEKLIRALASTPRIKIGAEVGRGKADKARQDFTRAGLEVDLVPVLSLEGMQKAEEQYTCPACGKKVQLTADRQCPSCGVYVDKLSEDYLLRKRIQEQERSRLAFQQAKDIQDGEKREREARETALRKQIREELEREYGLDAKPGVLGRYTGLAKFAGVLVLLGASFGAGQWRAGLSLSSGEGPAGASRAESAQDVDQMIDKLGAPSGAAPNPSELEGASPAPEDSLMAAAGQGRAGGKTLTVEQAVAAAQTLARSVGNRTGQGGGAGGQGGPEKGDKETSALPTPHRLALGVEFARALAEMGQLPRAREVVKSLRAAPGLAVDADAAALVTQVDFEVRAWGVAGAPEGRRRQLVDALRTDASGLPDAALRTRVLARTGAILAQSPGLPPEAAMAFLTLARSTIAQVTDPAQRSRVSGEFLVALSRTLLADSEAKASTGAWARVRALSVDIAALVAQAPDSETAVRLLALDLRGKALAGMGAEALPRLAMALNLVEKEQAVAARAGLLRLLATAPDTFRNAQFQAAIDRLATMAESKLGPAKAQALTTVALLHADVGAQDRFVAYRQRAQETQGLTGPESAMVNADLIVSGEIATARQLHGARAYAEAEALIRKVAGYLL